MRFFCFILISFCFFGNSLADGAILLAPYKGEKVLDVVATKNITGYCGGSIVRVLGVTSIVDNFYGIDLDAAKIIVRSGQNKELVLGVESNVLSDHNGVACVSTKSGNRLLIWSNCGGSACGGGFSFFIIDPERLIFLAPKDLKKGYCDEKCASNFLGSNFPKKINGN